MAVLLLYCASALPAEGLTPEQQRLRSCNTEAKAKGLSARERSRFITDCLNGRKGDRPLTPLQARNEACTREADNRHLEGAGRRGFMSDCNKPDQVKQETPDHVKVKNCDQRAVKRGLEGDERRKFVAACLDGSRVMVDG
ncbi:MAG TPA: PsiF family protein [Burkholderiales bacterium]|nr:PsiF family protein [Burkholderiales bacterium]